MKLKRVLDFCNSAHWKNVSTARLVVPPLTSPVGLIPEFLFPALQSLKLDGLRLTTDHEYVVVCPDYSPNDPFCEDAVNHRTERLREAISSLIDHADQFPSSTAAVNHAAGLLKAAHSYSSRPKDVVEVSEGWMAPPLAHVEAACCGLLGVRTYHAAVNLLRPPPPGQPKDGEAQLGSMVFERLMTEGGVVGVKGGSDGEQVTSNYDAGVAAAASAVDTAGLLRTPCVSLLVSGAARAAAEEAARGTGSAPLPDGSEAESKPRGVSAVAQLAASLETAVGIPAKGSSRRLQAGGAVAMCRYDGSVGYMVDTRFVYDLVIPHGVPLGVGGGALRAGGGGGRVYEDVPLSSLVSAVEDGHVDPVDAVSVVDFATRSGLVSADSPMWFGKNGGAEGQGEQGGGVSGYPFVLRSLRWSL